jgi:hypothetical protein
MLIADYLRVRFHRLRPATPLSSHTKAMRAVVGTRSDRVDARVAATNQLAALLDAHWLGAKAIFANIESAIALAFLTQYPSRLGRRSDRGAAGRLLHPAGLLRRETCRRTAGAAAFGADRHAQSRCA